MKGQEKMDNQSDIYINVSKQDDASKRHPDNDNGQDTGGILPVISYPDIVVWLRSLAPLTNEEVYDNSWRD